MKQVEREALKQALECGVNARRLGKQVDRMVQRDGKEPGLRRYEMEVLLALWEGSPEGATQSTSEMVERLELDQGSVSRAMIRFEALGLVESRTEKGRKQSQLTSHGWTLVSRLARKCALVYFPDQLTAEEQRSSKRVKRFELKKFEKSRVEEPDS